MLGLARTFICVLVLVACAAVCHGETILLKDGSRLTGRIVSADADSMHFETPDGVLTIWRGRIQSIDYGSQTAPAPVGTTATESSPAPASAAPAPSQESQGDHPSDSAARQPSRPHVFGELGYRFADAEAEGGLMGGLGIFGKPSPTVYLGGSVGVDYFTNKVESLSKGTVTLFPIMGRVMLREPHGFSFCAGIGYVVASHSLDAEVTRIATSLGLGVEENLKGAFGAEISAGYTAESKGRAKGGVFLGYRFHKPGVEATITDLVTGDFVTNSGSVSLSTPFIRGALFF